MTRARISQQGGVLAEMLIAILIVAAFFAVLYFFLDDAPSTGEEESQEPGAEEPFEPEEPAPEEPTDPDGHTEPESPVEEPAEITDPDGKVFSYIPVGVLLPESGPGFSDETVYRTDIVFPTTEPVFLNSQVYRHGGGQAALNDFTGGQCDASNYDYPWQDTFCEKRSREQALCPGGGHEGLDIRPHTCTKNTHRAVAVEDARVIDIRRHWVTLQTDDGTLYNYLHLNMSQLDVSLGETVSKGDPIGLISNEFYDSSGNVTPTTTHLHFEMYENYVASPDDEPMFTKVNPYMTLVAAYDRMLRGE